MAGPICSTASPSSISPAWVPRRAPRWLADYGADIVKVARSRRGAGAQMTPVFHDYSGDRGMRRVLMDLKADRGREAFLRLAGRPTSWSSRSGPV